MGSEARRRTLNRRAEQVAGILDLDVFAVVPVEAYLSRFDWLLVSRAQRQALRDYVVALLAPRERNKTLTALADAEPGQAESMHRETQRLQ